MKIVGFGEDSVGVTDGTYVWDVTEHLGWKPDWPPVSSVRFASCFRHIRHEIEKLLLTEPAATLADTTALTSTGSS
jgi:hypothetical protein